jgi:hypothetical protein
MRQTDRPIRHVAELIGSGTDSEKAYRWLIALVDPGSTMVVARLSIVPQNFLRHL